VAAHLRTAALPPDFDPHDDLQLDAVAGELVERYRNERDVAALERLAELAHARLHEVARGITRRLGVAIDPEELVAGLLTRLFLDVRRGQPRLRRFLGFAHTVMRNEALGLLRDGERQRRRILAWERHGGRTVVSRDPSAELDEREQAAIVARLGLYVLAAVSGAFHSLGERDRRILLLREVDGLEYAALAEQLCLPPNQVGSVLKRARERLLRRIATALGGARDDEGGAR